MGGEKVRVGGERGVVCEGRVGGSILKMNEGGGVMGRFRKW